MLARVAAAALCISIARAQTCADNEPTTTSANMAVIGANSCDSVVNGVTCPYSCSTGFYGGSVTCVNTGSSSTTNGNFTVVACSGACGPARARVRHSACGSPSAAHRHVGN